MSEIPPQGLTSDERTMAILAHMLGMVICLVSGTALGFVGPLVVWLIKKDESAFVGEHARQAMIFQIALVVVGLILFGAAFVLTCMTAGLAFPLIFLVAIAMFVISLVFPILAAVAANKGEPYTYPIVGDMF